MCQSTVVPARSVHSRDDCFIAHAHTRFCKVKCGTISCGVLMLAIYINTILEKPNDAMHVPGSG